MTYERIIPIEFNHCDPAGIVFYPRYFEMTNSVVENFFADVLDFPFARMHPGGNGVPTVRIEAEFTAPSRLGEKVAFTLAGLHLGSRSFRLEITADHRGQRRLRADITLVWTSDGRAAPWPDALRARLQAFMEGPR